MSGGGGPSGETKVEWNSDMAPRWNNLLNAGINNAFQVNPDGSYGIRPRETYGGERFAPITYDQYAAGSNIRSLNDLSTGTIQASNDARNVISKQLQGGYSNPYENQYTQTDRNLFAGDNPYFRTAMNTGLEDIANAYQQGTAADTTRQFALSGTFGGDAHMKKMANNEAALGKNLANYADSMLNQQYNRSAGLEDSFLSRDLQNQQFNKSGAMGAYDSEAARRMQAIGYGQNEQNMALDRANAQMGVGSMYQGQDQKNRDFQFDQWNMNQNHPFTSMNWLANLFGQSVGSGGMNQSIYQGGSSSAAPWLGAALGAYSMFGK